eukprot:2978121-Lingulodinium_polyedra.AAC.1
MPGGPAPELPATRRNPRAVGRGASESLFMREAPPVVGARGHELAAGAGVAEADARRELHDPIGGVAEDL